MLVSSLSSVVGVAIVDVVDIVYDGGGVIIRVGGVIRCVVYGIG